MCKVTMEAHFEDRGEDWEYVNKNTLEPPRMLVDLPSVGQSFSDHFQNEDEFQTLRQATVDELVYLQSIRRSSHLMDRTVLRPIIETAFCRQYQ